ncbi:MAG: FHA domain-containing protein [Acidobacteriia bacterium]|nr:FHA domain-containing protein [Terriglobia bacterium]
MPLDYGETQAVSALSGNAALIWIKEDGSEMRFPIFAAVTTIGRDATNMIPINDGTVSRFHAKLHFQNGQYVLVDLGSANKTFVNGQEVREVQLQSGSEIRFAQQRFVFQVVQAAAPPPQWAQAAPPMPQPPPMSMQPPPMGTPPMAARPMGAPPMGTPYRPPAAVVVSQPTKKKPKPIIILGGVFVILIVLVVVVAKMTQGPSQPPGASGAKQEAAPQAPAPVTTAPTPSPATPLPAEPTPGSSPAPTAGTTTPSSSVTTPGAAGPQAVGRLMDDAAALESTGRLREARQRYEQVLATDPTNSRARSHLEDLKQRINDAINLHFKNAKQAYDYLRLDEAIDEWNLVLALADPTDSRYVESQRGIQQAQARLKR